MNMNEKFTLTPANAGAELNAAFDIVGRYVNEETTDTTGLAHAMYTVLMHYQDVEVELDWYEQNHGTEESNGCRFCNLE